MHDEFTALEESLETAKEYIEAKSDEHVREMQY
jgi:hypothetical protein